MRIIFSALYLYLVRCIPLYFLMNKTIVFQGEPAKKIKANTAQKASECKKVRVKSSRNHRDVAFNPTIPTLPAPPPPPPWYPNATRKLSIPTQLRPITHDQKKTTKKEENPTSIGHGIGTKGPGPATAHAHPGTAVRVRYALLVHASFAVWNSRWLTKNSALKP